MVKMNKIKIFSLIAVFTSLFVGFKKLNAQDVSKFKCLKTLKGHKYSVYSVAYSPDVKRIISGSGDETVKIWDANTGQCLKTLEGHSDYILSVAYSPDGTKIISGSGDGTIKIWGEE